MKRADLLLLAVIAITVLLLGMDAVSGGSVSAFLGAHLRGFAALTGTVLGWIGLGVSPVLLIALLSALYGRFKGLPQPVSKLLRRLIAIFDTISLTVGDMVRWAALGLVLVTGLIVVQRYVFGVSITKLQESVIYLHAILFLLSSAATLYHVFQTVRTRQSLDGSVRRLSGADPDVLADPDDLGKLCGRRLAYPRALA